MERGRKREIDRDRGKKKGGIDRDEDRDGDEKKEAHFCP